MTSSLAAGPRGARWGRVALLAFALQLWSGWLLLGVWLSAEREGAPAILGRIRMLPAHPDWVLPALAQSAVVALVVVGVAGRWRAVWGVLAASVAGAIAWGVTFALVPNGAGNYLPFQAAQEAFTVGLVLAVTALGWRLGRWFAVPVVAVAGGGTAGVLRLVLTYTVYGVGWPEGWARGVTSEVIGVAMLGAAVALLRGPANAGRNPAPGEGRARSGAVVGTLGLLALTAVHLAAGTLSGAWTVTDSRRLLLAAGMLALLAAGTAIASHRAPRPRSA